MPEVTRGLSDDFAACGQQSTRNGFGTEFGNQFSRSDNIHQIDHRSFTLFNRQIKRQTSELRNETTEVTFRGLDPGSIGHSRPGLLRRLPPSLPACFCCNGLESKLLAELIKSRQMRHRLRRLHQPAYNLSS